jgi:parvulin-like peptidyl-prolyl isomerase
MEAMLAKENIDFFAKQLEGQNSTAIPTAIPKHILVKNRAALRKEVRAAKRYFKKLSQPEDDATTGTFR